MFRKGSRAPRRCSRFWALLVLAPLCSAEECAVSPVPVLRIVTPAAAAQLTHMPLTIEIDYGPEAEPGSLFVTLNGQDISDWFEVDPPVAGRTLAYADFVWGASFVLAGSNELEASVALSGSPGALRRVRQSFAMQGDPYADAVESYAIGSAGGFGLADLDAVVLGPPHGAGMLAGGLDVFSLGIDGEIVLRFTDNVIVDGPGVDFTVFENPFFQPQDSGFGTVVLGTLFSEAGEVSVSQDGVGWFTFACANSALDHPLYPGCAGVYPVLADGETDARHPSVPTPGPSVAELLGQDVESVMVPEGSGGDSFDLGDVGLAWARYVRIRAADHVVGPYGSDNAGFDLDAIAAVHSVPATDDDGNGIPDAVE